MIGSIHLNNQPIVTAHKIYDVISNNMLTQKFMSQNIRPKILPQE